MYVHFFILMDYIIHLISFKSGIQILFSSDKKKMCTLQRLQSK